MSENKQGVRNITFDRPILKLNYKRHNSENDESSNPVIPAPNHNQYRMEVTCPICFDHYNDKEKIPRILTCGHTFCQHCLPWPRSHSALHHSEAPKRRWFANLQRHIALWREATITAVVSHRQLAWPFFLPAIYSQMQGPVGQAPYS